MEEREKALKENFVLKMNLNESPIKEMELYRLLTTYLLARLTDP